MSLLIATSTEALPERGGGGRGVLVPQITFKLVASFLIPKIVLNCFYSLKYFDIVSLFPRSNRPCPQTPLELPPKYDDHMMLFHLRLLPSIYRFELFLLINRNIRFTRQ